MEIGGKKVEKLAHCRLCPRECGVNRLKGEAGFCGAVSEKVKVARAALHFWEEPCLSGEAGSGTVFFSYCNLRCRYCQNYEISTNHQGILIGISELADVFLRLQGKGALNINLVTPTHYIPQIREALLLAKRKGLSLPVVYNTSGYEKASSLRLLDGLIDIYLPDFKYFHADTASRLSFAGDYPEWARSALDEMVRQVGEPLFSDEGIMKKGVIVRHLLLPGKEKEGEEILSYLYNRYGDSIFFSIMNQYTPLPQVAGDPELDRHVSKTEYEDLVDHALLLGIENGFTQEGEAAAESFIPSFRGEGVFD